MGLSIARGIIEAHDGQIGVRNTGPGCEFVIRLPLAAHRPETDGKASELAVASSARQRAREPVRRSYGLAPSKISRRAPLRPTGGRRCGKTAAYCDR